MFCQLVLLLVLLLWSSSACAWAFEYRYKLHPSRRLEMCDLYLENLNSLDELSAICDRKMTGIESNGFLRLKWEDIDLRTNKNLAGKLYKFFTHGDQNYNDNSWLPMLMNEASRGLSDAKKTTIDIDNDGTIETVVLFRRGLCGISKVFYRSLAILTKNLDEIDYNETEPLLQNPAGDDLINIRILAQGGSLGQVYDVFLYKGRYYFDKYEESRQRVVVYEILDNMPDVVCTYELKR